MTPILKVRPLSRHGDDCIGFSANTPMASARLLRARVSGYWTQRSEMPKEAIRARVSVATPDAAPMERREVTRGFRSEATLIGDID